VAHCDVCCLRASPNKDKTLPRGAARTARRPCGRPPHRRARPVCGPPARMAAVVPRRRVGVGNPVPQQIPSKNGPVIEINRWPSRSVAL
jgi:hypothetical protein